MSGKLFKLLDTGTTYEIDKIPYEKDYLKLRDGLSKD